MRGEYYLLHPLPSCSELQREFRDDLTDLMSAVVVVKMLGHPEPQQELVELGHDPLVDLVHDDDPLRGVSQELRGLGAEAVLAVTSIIVLENDKPMRGQYKE